MRATLKNILLGICLGSALFVVTGVVFDVINGQRNEFFRELIWPVIV